MDTGNKAAGLDCEQDLGRTDSNEHSNLSLHPEHIPVTRLSRKALVGLGGGFAIILGAATIFALQTGSGGAGREELFATNQKPSADALADLPEDYSAIPQLGPPLPGDLGKPILDAGAQYDLPPPAATTPHRTPASRRYRYAIAG